MLDATTKRKIDSARQILVGKVPDPKAQVEQITTALVYKFMDDMDKESQELGGKTRFFNNGFEKYSWTKVLDKRLSGQERLDLYVQAITNMSKNPHIPQLFRDIFKDAFLPYRDPETLSLFLKEIDSFTYDHSEDLGNAFEYLLSALGSQGEAGQFRTPRHIIEFIVSVVDPKKKETLLDPACGTAGFLISAYKHILKNNSSNHLNNGVLVHKGESAEETVIESKEKYSGDLLTPEEKGKVMDHIVGYDISPDMVKLSLVNMYLHGFPAPNVYEYDSLTSEKRWDENFDVIMANPPFMTPKGGIRPHKRFLVQSSRAEVLFVDYIWEHLNVNGRAGVIVPEGILGNANASYYKKIRETILEGLYAIVGFHQFTFAPYAEVNTYALFIDKNLGKKAKDVLFIDVINDGFDKSSQRRAISKNDLPIAHSILEEYKKSLSNNQKYKPKKDYDHFKLVSKKEILDNPDYILLHKKYTDIEIPNTSVPIKNLGDLIQECKEKAGINPHEVWSVSNKYGFVKSEEYFDKKIASKNTSNYRIIKPGYFAFNPSRINVGSIACNFTDSIGIVSPMYTVFKIKDQEEINPTFLLMYLKSNVCKEHINHLIHGATRKVLKKNDLKKLKIPLPSLKEQLRMLSEIDTEKQKITGLEERISEHEQHIDGIINGIWDK